MALEAGLAELDGAGARGPDLAERLDALRERRGAVGEAANHALRGPLPGDVRAAVEDALERLEAALRARSAAGFD